jgi:hypothetical protein
METSILGRFKLCRQNGVFVSKSVLCHLILCRSSVLMYICKFEAHTNMSTTYVLKDLHQFLETI